MINKKHILHGLLLLIEVAALFSLFLWPVFVDGEEDFLVHFHWKATYALAILGMTAFSMCFALNFYFSGAHGSGGKSRIAFRTMMSGLVFLSLCCIVWAGCLIFTEYPEFFRFGKPLTGSERIAHLGGTVVLFDADGGTCMDSVRILKRGATYSDNVNVYVLDDERNFSELKDVRVNLPRSLLIASITNRTHGVQYAHYFSTNAIPVLSKSEKWSYAVEVERINGKMADWYVGQTWSTNNNVYSHLAQTRIGTNDGEWTSRIFHIGITPWSNFNLLDRGVIFIAPGQSLEMAFRVSLFAGTGITELNYHYVRPGGTLACPLPKPIREGYSFEGWFDNERRITEDSTVEKAESHTLKARWREL